MGLQYLLWDAWRALPKLNITALLLMLLTTPSSTRGFVLEHLEAFIACARRCSREKVPGWQKINICINIHLLPKYLLMSTEVCPPSLQFSSCDGWSRPRYPKNAFPLDPAPSSHNMDASACCLGEDLEDLEMQTCKDHQLQGGLCTDIIRKLFFSTAA